MLSSIIDPTGSMVSIIQRLLLSQYSIEVVIDSQDQVELEFRRNVLQSDFRAL